MPASSPAPVMPQAQQAIAQLLERCGPTPAQSTPHTHKIDQLETLEQRLQARTLKVAVFGLVSRGKSAVINAIMGDSLLETGPLHGVTAWPRSVLWRPSESPGTAARSGPVQVEFIDTPGLDEVDGDQRAAMAQAVAHQADLILFVVAGDITPLEYTALVELQQAQKPVMLVFNKVDLYPEVDQAKIYQRLQQLAEGDETAAASPLAPVDAVIQVAAAPAPVQVRTEWADGRVTHAWESPEPEIQPLRQALITILEQDGAALVALNVLHQAQILETQLVSDITQQQQPARSQLLRRHAQIKAAAVALLPLAPLDILLALGADLVLTRNLARLYGFPITTHGARRLWKSLLVSSGSLALSEGVGWLMGGNPLAWGDVALTAWLSAAVLQGGVAAYGSYVVGNAADRYLQQGYTWADQGVSTLTQAILAGTRPIPVLQRWRQQQQQRVEAAAE